MFYKITRSDDSAKKTIHQTHTTITSSGFLKLRLAVLNNCIEKLQNMKLETSNISKKGVQV
ncbi:MAG: hypothetical protein H7250_09980 [Flavobacterium sp.]|nr:hypothetical protein [Flavobacterium sp.]